MKPAQATLFDKGTLPKAQPDTYQRLAELAREQGCNNTAQLLEESARLAEISRKP
jgi:hypothetical protein